MNPRTVIWRRLDVEGMDACRIRREDTGWRLEGAAVFVEAGMVTRLAYRLACAADWSSLEADVEGWVGRTDFSLALRRTTDGGWTVDGRPDPSLTGLRDVDLGFTPATNTNAIRRLAPAPGYRIETTAVWLDTADWSVKRLPQSYERLSERTFAYASPTHDYRAVLETDDFGIVSRYPGLWEALPAGT